MKKKTTKRRRKSALSAGPRRRRSHKKSFLSELTNPTQAKEAGKATLAAALGGFSAVIVNKTVLPEKWGKGGKIGAALIGGFLLNNFGMKSLGTSFTGGMIALAFQSGLLNEDANFADDNVLSDQPLYLDEAGTPMVLEEDGQGNEYFRPMTGNEAEQMGY